MHLAKTISITMTLCMLALPGLAGEERFSKATKAQETTMLAKKDPAALPADKELAGKRTEFTRFAHNKIKEFNRNHHLSRSRMQITRQADGSWRALYHEIDDKTLLAQVRRSQSQAIPFVGVLSYQEQVFEAHGKAPDQFPSDAFDLVRIIPNRHIFSYKQGAWK